MQLLCCCQGWEFAQSGDYENNLFFQTLASADDTHPNTIVKSDKRHL